MGRSWYYVTGCDSGFGADVVRRLASSGHAVFAGHYMPESAAGLREDGKGNIEPVLLDVTSDQSVAEAAEKIRGHLKDGDVLAGVVNNAGLMVGPGPAEWIPTSNWTQMYEVNVVGTVRVTKSVLPLIRKSQGRVVNVASMAGRVGIPTQAAYCASKYAVEAFSDTLRREMYVWGVSVHIIEPGVFAHTGLYATYHKATTEMWEKLTDEVKHDYGQEYMQHTAEDSVKALSKFNNKDTSLVPKAMIHALTAKTPLYRYRVGTDSRYLTTFLCSLHERWQDMFILASGKGRSPAGADKKAKVKVWERYPHWTLARIVMIALFVLLLRFLRRKYLKN